MKVVLLQDVKTQGKKGDIIDVSEGYARNFLFPKKFATPAQSQILNDIKGKEEAKEFHIAEDKAQANKLKTKLEANAITIVRPAGDGNKFYGSVTNKDISEAIKASIGCDVDKRKILLPKAIKDYGEYKIQVKLYTEITAELTVIVKNS